MSKYVSFGTLRPNDSTGTYSGPLIYRLPYEATALIFELAAFRDTPTAFRISHVSQRWRTIALERRGLWTTIRVEENLEKVSILLERSGNKLIDIDMHASCSPLYRDILLPIAKHCHRWRSFSLTPIGSVPIVGQFLRTLHTPRLESLMIPSVDAMKFANTPSVRRLSVSVEHISRSKLMANARLFKQLTHLSCPLAIGNVS